MSRIVINSLDLADAAALMDTAAGEFQAIGSHVVGCDCGCMPADVAGVVDAVTAEVRTGLQGIAAQLDTEAAELSWRAGVDQDGGFTAVGAASGDAQPAGMAVGGYGGDFFSGGTGGGMMSVGGSGLDASFSSAVVVGPPMSVGGFGGLDFGRTGGGTISIGGGSGGLDFGSAGGGTVSIGGGAGGLDFGSGGGGTISIGGGAGGLDLGGGEGGTISVGGGAGGLDFSSGGGTIAIGGGAGGVDIDAGSRFSESLSSNLDAILVTSETNQLMYDLGLMFDLGLPIGDV